MATTARPPQHKPLPDDSSARIDLAISLVMHDWPALTLAVQSSWGGPTSSDKRDWFCGAISELFVDRPETDAQDVEEVLIQVMSDEFDVVVDDESAGDVADRICELREECIRGEYETLQAMWDVWGERKDRGALFKKVETDDGDQETDEDEDEEDEEDVDMGEAPALVRCTHERPVPEVDEEGFTKVVGKKKS
jgi:pre-rRNA-processing protein TSR2